MKKHTLKSFQEAAKKIVEKYMGIVPNWELRISARLETDFFAEIFSYSVTFEHRDIRICHLSFFGYSTNPSRALQLFENSFIDFFDLYNDSEDIKI